MEAPHEVFPPSLYMKLKEIIYLAMTFVVVAGVTAAALAGRAVNTWVVGLREPGMPGAGGADAVFWLQTNGVIATRQNRDATISFERLMFCFSRWGYFRFD